MAAMTEDPARTGATRVRREPPRFRRIVVRRAERLTPRMARVTFTGPELAGLTVDEPAASVRLLLPSPGADALVIPDWNGNEFLLPGGERPVIRTFTPHRVRDRELELLIVLHEGGAASTWAEAAAPGAAAAVSGPGRGYAIDREAPAFMLAGDETAIPAIAQLLAAMPAEATVQVHVEIAHPVARLAVPEHPRASVQWHHQRPGAPPGDTLVAAVRGADLDPSVRVWAAGEAAAMQRIRKDLAARELPRTRATVRGYWKRARRGVVT